MQGGVVTMVGRTALRDDARWTISLVLGTAFAYLMVGLLSLSVLVEYEGEGIPHQVLATMQTGSVVELVLFAASAIAWLVWQRRLNTRLRGLGREGMRFTPGWTVGWYFIPFANLLMPPQMMQELWQASDPHSDAQSWKSSAPSNRIYAWWSLFIIANLISRAGLTAAMGGERAASLVTDVISSALIVASAVIVVGLLRELELRMRKMEAGDGTSVAGGEVTPGPKTSQVVAGAFVGAAVATAWWVTFEQIVRVVDFFRSDFLLGLPVAIVFGAIVGFWTLLGGAGRSRAATVAAGVTGYFALLLANLLLGAPIIAVLTGVFARPGQLVGYLASVMAGPLVMGMAVLSVGAAIAMVLVKLPIDLWMIGGEAPTEATPAGSVIAAPLPAPVAEPPRPVAAEPPATAPAVMEPPATAQPAVMEPPATVSATAGVRRVLGNRTALLVLAGVAVVVIAAAAFMLGRTSQDTVDSQAATSPVQAPAPDPVPVEPAAPSLSQEALPEDVITAFYTAAARGDEEALSETYAPGFSLGAEELSRWGDPVYTIELVTAGRIEGEIRVEVHEETDGFPDADIVTYTLRLDAADHWRISGWWLGKALDDPSFAPQPGVVNPQLSRPEQKAVETVATFLQHRMGGAVDDMKKLATTAMPKRQPKVFVMQFGDFTAFEITSVRAVGDTYMVTARETWESKDVVHDYVVVEQDGKMRVSERR